MRTAWLLTEESLRWKKSQPMAPAAERAPFVKELRSGIRRVPEQKKWSTLT